MGIHMKITVEIADPLLASTRRVARREGTTVRAVIERSLRRELQQEPPRKRFTLRRASFRGRGLQREFAGADWGTIRDAAYQHRGA